VVGDGDDERFLLDARADDITDGERDAVNCLL